MDSTPIISDSGDSPFTLFSVNDVTYGVSSSNVLSIMILQPPTPVVNAPAYNLGIMDFRGDMIPLIGLRKLFGQPERGGELRSVTESLAEQHEHWHDDVGRAMAGLAPFPDLRENECALGRWLANNNSTNTGLNVHLQKMQMPHAQAHLMARQAADNLKSDKPIKDIRRRFEEAHTNLAMLIETAPEAYADGLRDMLLVVTSGELTKGIVVDDIVSVEYISRFIELPENSPNRSPYVLRIAKRDKDDSTVLLLDEAAVLTL